MSGGAILHGLAPEQLGSCEEMSHQWQAVGGSMSDSTEPEIELLTSRTESDVFNLYPRDVQPFNQMGRIAN